jgi:hypothetical protein
MTEKTPRELLRESLLRNAEELAALPTWLRSDAYTESVFSVPSSADSRHDASPVTVPPTKG